MAMFKGFSTASETDKTTLVDVDLVKQDLLNALRTRKGERLMRGNYGCGVWDYIFNPLDEITKEAVVEELRRIVALDPRLQLVGVRVQEYEFGLQCILELKYINLRSTEALFVQFDNRNNQLISAVIPQ